MRENDGSAFALVDIGHSLALDFQELLSRNGCALSVIAFLLWSIRNQFDVAHLCNRPVGPENTAPFICRSSGSRVGEMRGSMALKPALGAAKSTRDGRRKLGMMLGCK